MQHKDLSQPSPTPLQVVFANKQILVTPESLRAGPGAVSSQYTGQTLSCLPWIQSLNQINVHVVWF